MSFSFEVASLAVHTVVSDCSKPGIVKSYINLNADWSIFGRSLINFQASIPL